MKLGIMQPYFFPYIGYFSLIANTDHFVFFDTPQYEPRSWMNRNRIINLGGDFTYITAAVKKAHQNTAIKDIYLAEPEKWADKLLGQLSVYKKKAPNYSYVISLIEEVAQKKHQTLADLNIDTIVSVCNYIGIPLHYDRYSQMNLPLELEKVHEPDEWALQITKAMGYNTYINPPGGISFFHREKYTAEGINLQFLQADLVPYDQKISRFEPGLSIIDVMMFNSKETIREMLGKYTLIEGAHND